MARSRTQYLMAAALAASACTTFGDAEVGTVLPQGDELWTDGASGAQWTLSAARLSTWEEAGELCRSLDRGGVFWRLPTVEEATAMAQRQVTPIEVGAVWTTEPADFEAGSEGYIIHTAWTVRMQDGATGEEDIEGDGLALCIDRGSEDGQEVCLSGVDEDGDTFTDCEDIGCWHREPCGSECAVNGGGDFGIGCACLSDEGCDDMADHSGEPLGRRCVEGSDGMVCQ